MAKARQAKVLRIGIIQDGKIVQERLIKAGESVTVGESAKNSFVFPKTHLPTAEFKVFKATGKGYQLQFTEQMRGKISSGGAVVALQKLVSDPSVTRSSDIFTLPLTEQDRGKINIDSVTVLFQFVAPPPVQAVKPIQAMNFRPRLLEDDDPVFLGFLVIWMALAVVLVIWVNNTEPREMSFDDIPDRFTKIVIKEKKEKPEPLETEGEDPSKIEKPKEAEKPKEVPKEAEKPKESKGETAVEKAKRQQDMKDEVLKQSKLLLKIIGTTGESSGGVVENLWSDEEQGLGDIDQALAEASGVTTEADKATRGGTGGRGEAADIDDLGNLQAGNSDVGEVQEVVVASVTAGASGTVDEEIGDRGAVTATVKRYTGQLQYCYESRLKQVPSLAGRVEVGWTVAGGAVESLYVVSNSTGDAELASCITRRIRRWSFPDSVEGDITWPFVFAAKRG
jgi:hypothetical protein